MLYSSLILLLVIMTVKIGRPEESDDELIITVNEPGKPNKEHFSSLTKKIEQIKKRDKHDSQHQSTFYESILKDVNDNAMTKKFESINNLNEDNKKIIEKGVNEMKDTDVITSSRESFKYDSIPLKSNYKLSKDQLELNEKNTVSLKNETQMDERSSDSKDRANNLKDEGKYLQNFVHLMNSFDDPFNSGQEGISALSKKDCHLTSGYQNFYSGEILNQPKACYFKAADKTTEPKHNYAFSEVKQYHNYPYKVGYNLMQSPPTYILKKNHKAYSNMPYTAHRDKPNNFDSYNITSLVSSLGAEIPRKYETEYFGKIETRQNYPESKLNLISKPQHDNFTDLKNINIDPSDEINVNSSLNLNNPKNICQVEYRNIVNEHFDANDKPIANTLSNTKRTSVKKNSIHQNSKLFIKSNDLSDQIQNRYEPFRNEINQKYLDLLHSSNNLESVNSVKQLKSFKNDNNDNHALRSQVNFSSNPSRFKPPNEKIYVPEYEKINDLECNDNQPHFKDIKSAGTASHKESNLVMGTDGRMPMYWSRLPLSSCLEHIFNSSMSLNLKQNFERQLYNNLNEGFVIIPLNRYMEMNERGYLNNVENNHISTVDTSYSHFFRPVGSELYKNMGNGKMNLYNVALTETKNMYPITLTQDQAVESESGRQQMEMGTRSNNSTLVCIPPTNKWTMSSSIRPDQFLHHAFFN